MKRLIDLLTGEDKKRENELREYAFRTNKLFSSKDAFNLPAQLSEFKLFNIGTRKNALNLVYSKDLTGSDYLFDYRYTISTGKSSHTFTQTFKFFDSKDLGIPGFQLKPESFFTKLMEWFGGQDIDFEDDKHFSSAFNLKGEFEPLIRRYFDNEVRQLCLNNKSFYMEGMNYYLGIYIEHKVLKGSELNAFDRLTQLIYELFINRSKDNLIRS